MQCFSSFFNSVVDLTGRCDIVDLDKNEGGPEAADFVPFFLTFAVGLGLATGLAMMD